MLKSILSILVVCALAIAQDKEPSAFGQHAGPQAPSATPITIDWAEQAQFAQQHGPSAAWRAEHPGWKITFDPRTGMPYRAFGPGIQVAPSGATRDQIVGVAATLKDQLSAVAGFAPDDFRFVVAARAGRLWYVDFAQVISGAPVWNGGLTMRIDQEGRLVMWGGRFVEKQVASEPSITSDQAIAAAFSHLGRDGLLSRDTAVLGAPAASLVVHVLDGRDRRTPTLAWKAEISTESPTGSWIIFVDARDGSVLQYWNDDRESCHGHAHDGDDHDVLSLEERMRSPLFMVPVLASFSGVATGTVHEGVIPQAAPVLRTFQDMYVNCNGLNVLTDASGAYTFTGGGATVPVVSGLDGVHFTTNNAAGVQALFSATGTTGTVDIPWTDVNSTLAERDVFFFANKAWHNVFLRNPAETLFQTTMLANVNVTGTCNAFYSPGLQTINFYPAGGTCFNTAYSESVVVHEFGHHVTTRIYILHGTNVPGGMGEGYSDCQGGAVTDSNLVGEGWSGIGTTLRNLDNTCQYPASCGTEVHAYGKVIGACYWHTRQLFATAYGAAGKVMMDEYLYQHFHGTPLAEPESVMEMMLLNDDDADLTNGTPDAAKFYDAFTILHSVPFPIPVIDIFHLPLHPTMDQLQNYQIHGSAVPKLAAGISSASTFYAINAGGFLTLPMVNNAGDWVASIPVQPAGTTIRYYLQFTDTDGRVVKFPAGGAAQALSFLTSRRSQFFFDGFEVASGWVSATQLGANDWHNQAPGNPSHAYDPATAYEGTKCFGNDLSPPGFNGNYPNNVFNHLTSPTINCTGQTGIALVYRRWLTVEDGTFDHARVRVSNNNGTSFTTVWENPIGTGAQHFIDAAWNEHVVDISALADNQANVKVRFEMQSDAGLALGGWNIDAFSLASANAALPLSIVGSTAPGQVATIRTSGLLGDALLMVADISVSTNFYLGIGTLSMNAGSPTLLLLYDGSQTIPASGVFDLTFVVPPASGLTVYLQGLVVPANASPPLLITNVLPFTIL